MWLSLIYLPESVEWHIHCSFKTILDTSTIVEILNFFCDYTYTPMNLCLWGSKNKKVFVGSTIRELLKIRIHCHSENLQGRLNYIRHEPSGSSYI